MSFYFAGRYFNKYRPYFAYEQKDYSFKVDLQVGELYFVRKLFSLPGRYLPISLSLYYNQRHAYNSYDDLYLSTGFPRGFKTNYHIFLEFDSDNDKYKYEDADGFLHEFKRNNISDSLYYDNFGTGLMLQASNSGFDVFDDDYNCQHFDQLGRLTTIRKRITSSHYAEIHVYYADNSSLKIDHIVDNYGKTVYFVYTVGQSIAITLNNNTIVTLYQNSYYVLSKLTKNIGSCVVEDLFEQSTHIVTGLTLFDGESFSFTYSDDYIDGFITNINQDVFYFDYDLSSDKWATVTNARGVSTQYDFSGNQSVLHTKDDQNNDLAYFKINSDTSSCIIKNTLESNEITEFLFNNQSSVETNSYSTGYSDFALNNNLQAKKMYLLVVEINGNLAHDSFQIQLFDYDNNFLAELIFKDKETVLSFPVGIKVSTQKQFRLKYKNNCPNHIDITKARLVPLIGDFEVLCTNVDTGGPVFFYGNEPHYVLKNGNLYSVDNSIVNNLGLPVIYGDIKRNEKLFYKMGTYFHFWCDDFKNFFENISSAVIAFPNDKYISFDSSRGEISLLDEDFTYEEKVEFYRLIGKDDNSLSAIKISHDSSSFHTGYTSFYYEEEETKYVGGNPGYVTYYDYDQNYLLKELNRSDCYKEEYVYDTNGNLLSKTSSHIDIFEQIKYEYSYDSNDNLISENKLVGSSVEQATFYYNNFHKLSKIEYPNSSFENYTYDSITAERETTVAFGHNNSSDFSQYIIVIDSDHFSYLTEDNCYSFAYSGDKLVSVSYNNQQIFSISYLTEIYSGASITEGNIVTYSNGGYIETTYDPFGRVYTTNNCLYHYNLCSNLSAITDAYYSASYTSIIYTRNYSNQPTVVDHRYNHLTNNLEYDIYRRLVSQSFLYNDSDIYTVDYIYYNKPTLENTVNESSVSYGSINLGFIDNTDDFSRLISQSITINNIAFTDQIITYCVGGPNNSQTNNMIKSVEFKAWTINPSAPFIIPTLREDSEYSYSYDGVGNITTIVRRNFNLFIYQIDYVYDSHSRLIRENNPLLNKSFEFSYDDEGNITFKKEYAYSTNQQLTNPDAIHTYSYDSIYPNRLTGFDNESISYDSVGNPTTYRGKTMSWTKGTLLSQVYDGNKYINFEYDGLKQRVLKTISSGQTTYYGYNNDLLIRETRGTQTITYIYSHKGVMGFVLEGFYDTSGATPVSLDGLYIYEKNIRQDVVAIRNSDRVVVARYSYDAWGNHQVLNRNNVVETNLSSVGHINPIRYRSYYYDTDLKMYWLTTRYYDPEVGRFISPDDYSYLDYRKLHGINLYAYCKNNPVMYADPSGHFWWIIVAAVVAVVAVTHTAVKTVQAVHEKMAASTEKTILSEDEQREKGYEEVNVDGLVFYFREVPNVIKNGPKELEILDSWKFTKAEVLMILNCLKYEEGYNNLNIARVYNEWQWHNVAYTLGYDKEASGSVNFYLNARDNHHGLLGYIFDFWWLG